MSNFYHLKSVSELHRFFNLKKPSHPLITIIKEWPKIDFNFENIKMKSDFYVIGLKGNVKGKFKYGRSSYDYDEGTLVFLAPNQVTNFDAADAELDDNGWNIFFHPDLIRKSILSSTIKSYSFFDYGINEALHVSENEKNILTDFVQKIEGELEQNMDKHSQELILANLESLLKYCLRYYDRQFYSRTNLNKDLVDRFNKFLENYFSSDELKKNGLPTLGKCGEALNMSGSYLSDLLRLETGRSAKDHIHDFIIERAKNLLLGTNNPVSEIAYNLGFDYPQHFTKLFKLKTGLNPTDFRKSN